MAIGVWQTTEFDYHWILEDSKGNAIYISDADMRDLLGAQRIWITQNMTNRGV